MPRAGQKICKVEIENFRGLNHLTLEKVGTINIFVGKNSVGKSTILEAIHLACSGNNPMEFHQLAQYRGILSSGTLIAESYFSRYNTALQPRCKVSSCSTEGTGEKSHEINLVWEKSVAATPVVQQIDSTGYVSSANRAPERAELGTLVLTYSHPGLESTRIHKSEIVFALNQSYARKFDACGYCIQSRFIPHRSSQSVEPAQLFSSLARTGNDGRFRTFLKEIDPRIESLRVTAEIQPASLAAKLIGHSEEYPVALMGDGVQRAMAIAGKLFESGIEVLCIDEIDSGLHRSAMLPLWRGLYAFCRDNGVQLFCTTHDEEMISALIESIQESHPKELSNLYVNTLHRRNDGEITVITRDGGAILAGQNANIELMS